MAAGAWGLTEAGGDEPVTTDTIFQAGSVSKPVAAFGALLMVTTLRPEPLPMAIWFAAIAATYRDRSSKR